MNNNLFRKDPYSHGTDYSMVDTIEFAGDIFLAEDNTVYLPIDKYSSVKSEQIPIGMKLIHNDDDYIFDNFVVGNETMHLSIEKVSDTKFRCSMNVASAANIVFDIPYESFLEIKSKLVLKETDFEPVIERISNIRFLFAYSVQLSGNTLGEILSKAQEFNSKINEQIFEAASDFSSHILMSLGISNDIKKLIKLPDMETPKFMNYDKDNFEIVAPKLEGERVTITAKYPMQYWFLNIKPEWFLMIKEKLILSHSGRSPVIMNNDLPNKSITYSFNVFGTTIEEKNLDALMFNSQMNDSIIRESMNMYEYLNAVLGIEAPEDNANSPTKAVNRVTNWKEIFRDE